MPHWLVLDSFWCYVVLVPWLGQKADYTQTLLSSPKYSCQLLRPLLYSLAGKKKSHCGESELLIQYSGYSSVVARQGAALILLNGTVLSDHKSFWFFSVCAGLFLALILGSFEGTFNLWLLLLNGTLPGFFLVQRELPGQKCSWLFSSEDLFPDSEAGIPNSFVRSFCFPYSMPRDCSEQVFQLPNEDCTRDPEGDYRWKYISLPGSFLYLILLFHRSLSIIRHPPSILQQSVCFTTMALILFHTFKLVNFY